MPPTSAGGYGFGNDGFCHGYEGFGFGYDGPSYIRELVGNGFGYGFDMGYGNGDDGGDGFGNAEDELGLFFLDGSGAAGDTLDPPGEVYAGASGSGSGSGDGHSYGFSGHDEAPGFAPGIPNAFATYWNSVQPAQISEKMLMEENAELRRVLLRIYGVDRFVLGGRVLSSYKGYVLMERELERVKMRILKMVCPSTGAVYASPVPPDVRTVREALAWKYQLPKGRSYFRLVQKET